MKKGLSRREFLRSGSKTVGAAAVSMFYPGFLTGCTALAPQALGPAPPEDDLAGLGPDTQLLLPTFLGNDQRRVYGRGAPEKLTVQNRFRLGAGRTRINGALQVWGGAGWTGQPTLVRDQGRIYLVIGSFDHHLRKIDLASNQEVWRYKFDDVIKGSATIFIDRHASEENRIVILQGSRAGIFHGLASPFVPSFRAVSFRTGRELWRLNVKRTPSYSRDNDSSAIFLGDGLVFNAAENGIGYFINSDASRVEKVGDAAQPEIVAEVDLFHKEDYYRHGGNLVAEASPARLHNRLYIASGAGHIFGVDIKENRVVWDFFTGADMNGTTAVSQDGYLFAAVEKQYIPGPGGVLKLDPVKTGAESVRWYLPTLNRGYAEWRGGVIGSVGLNDEYVGPDRPALFAALGVDGNLYLGSQHEVSGQKTPGPLARTKFDIPKVVCQKRIGPSISTPVFTDQDRLVAATYQGVYLFQIHFEPAPAPGPETLTAPNGKNFKVALEQKDHFLGGYSFEATPAIWGDQVMICCRDSYLYTLG